MKIIRTKKSILSLTKEEANKFIKLIYKYSDLNKIPGLVKISVFDEDDCSMLVIFKYEFQVYRFVFEATNIFDLDLKMKFNSTLIVQFLLENGYLTIK